MADFNTKQYLDLAGLKAFWGIIKDKFVSDVKLTMGETGAVLEGSFGDGDKLTIGTIPMATANNAGLMSAAQAKTVNEFADGVAALVPLTDVKVAGTSATLTNRAVNLDFIYNSDAKEIQVVDKNNANAVLTKIDATAFIKDGMVSDVRLDGNNLVIDFNTDSGIKDIVLPLDKFIDIYQSGAGVEILNGNIIAVKTNSEYLSADKDGLKVTDALWTEVDRRDTVIDGKAQGYASAAETTAKGYTDTKIGTLIKDTVVAEIEAAKTEAKDYAKDYTDGVVGTLPTNGEGKTLTVAEAIAAAVKDASDASDAADKALEDAKAYTDTKIGTLTKDTVVAEIGAAKDDAISHANGLNTAMNTRVEALEAIDHDHDNKTVLDGITAEKVAAWDVAEENAKAYTDTKIGTLTKDTVVAEIGAAKDDAKSYADTQAAAVYAAIEAIPVGDITFDKLNA